MFTLARKEIRLQFSGYAIFAAKLLSVATGFFFQLLLTRSLLGSPATSPQYGIYLNINDVLVYFTIPGSVVPFWVMRYFARGKEGAVKTGLATTAIISLIFAAIYLGSISFLLPWFGGIETTLPITTFLPMYLIAVIQIVELYFFGLFETCLQANQPQAVGYGLIIQQVIKVSVGYVLIAVVGQPLLGAIVATIISFATQLIYYYALLAPEMKQKIQWGYVREWLKGSVLTLYSVIGIQLAAFILLMLFKFGGENGRGIYGVAFQIATIITYSSFLSFALYPKLLAEKKREDITTSLKMVLMFAIPMAVGAIALADSYIMLLAPDTGSFVLYQQGYIVIMVLAIDSLFTVGGGLLNSVVQGFESVDQGENVTMKQLLKSRMFSAYSLTYVQAAITIPVTYFVLTTYTLGQPLEAAFAVSIINTSVHFVTLVLLYLIARKVTQIVFPWKNIAKYLLASGVMGAFLFFLQPHPDRISITLIETAIGGLIYLTVLMAIDKDARGFPRGVIQEAKSRFSRKKST